MKNYGNLTGDRTVFVREYVRFKNGKWETVASHFRRPRSQRGQ